MRKIDRPSATSALRGALLGALWLVGMAAPVQAQQSFWNFESGQVRPLALSPDGTELYAVNTPDNRLEIFDVVGGTLAHAESVPVGMEPVAVAARSNTEVWVVNHLSDSISIVDLASTPPRVVRTLLVGDEPRDIVFAGPGGSRAFITTAHRGQNLPAPPTHPGAQLFSPGVGRADVWVFNANDLGTSLGGTPLNIITLFGDTPRALATNGSTVYAAVFQSGNQTTTLSEGTICNGGAGPGPAPDCTVLGDPSFGLPPPNVNVQGLPQPEVGLIVRRDPASGQWRDELGHDFSASVNFNLPDLDVFSINANANPPAATGVNFASVGTIIFNMVVANGKVYVSNTEARNEVRFEGPGTAFGSTTVRGHLHEARITILNGATVTPRRLNKNIDYGTVPSPAGVKQNSLATPTGMVVTPDGNTLYVAAFGSSKVGIFNTTQLENNTFTSSSANHIPVSGGGPSGLVLHPTNNRLYVFTRFDNSISVINTASNVEVDHIPVYSPEPAAVTGGRPFLYDAVLTSSNGEASCSSCHVFGDFDSLAWDLGNPDENEVPNPIPTIIPPLGIDGNFHPLKGPMTTQTLRGMANHGSMHWRGDRTGGNDPGGNSFDENAAFLKFNPAFVGLIGNGSQLTPAQMQAFANFILTVVLPPNPIRGLNNSLVGNQILGSNVFFGPNTDGPLDCNGCHVTNETSGFFGTDGRSTFEGETQMFKVAHLRNAYQKVGMFGMSPVSSGLAGPFSNTGNQVRGFGFLHDGSVDTVRRFLSASVFTTSTTEEQQLEEFVMAFPTNLRPIVGQQITLRQATPAELTDMNARIDLMLQRDNAGDCEVIVKGNIAGLARGAVRLAGGQFRADKQSDPLLSDTQVRALATGTPGQELTYSCVPPGAGTRMGIDRDEDGCLDRDELDLGGDPADSSSNPCLAPTPTPTPPGATPTPPPGVTPTPTPTPPGATPTPVLMQGIRSNSFSVRDDASPPIDVLKRRITFLSAYHRGSSSGVVVPPFGSPISPTASDVVLTVYSPTGAPGEAKVLSLPASNWAQIGTADKPGWIYKDPQGLLGPIRRVTLRTPGKLKISGKGNGLYALTGAPQGSMALRFSLGGGHTIMCVVAPAREPAASNDTTERFNGERDAPRPFICPPVP